MNKVFVNAVLYCRKLWKNLQTSNQTQYLRVRPFTVERGAGGGGLVTIGQHKRCWKPPPTDGYLQKEEMSFTFCRGLSKWFADYHDRFHVNELLGRTRCLDFER
jgi:hypothetical protein